METVFVLAADRGRMTDEKTGEIRPWANVHYLTDYRDDSENAVGYKPIKVRCTDEAFDEIRKNGVGLYRLDFRTRPGKDGVPTMLLVKAQLAKKVEIFKS